MLNWLLTSQSDARAFVNSIKDVLERRVSEQQSTVENAKQLNYQVVLPLDFTTYDLPDDVKWVPTELTENFSFIHQLWLMKITDEVKNVQKQKYGCVIHNRQLAVSEGYDSIFVYMKAGYIPAILMHNLMRMQHSLLVSESLHNEILDSNHTAPDVFRRDQERINVFTRLEHTRLRVILEENYFDPLRTSVVGVDDLPVDRPSTIMSETLNVPIAY